MNDRSNSSLSNAASHGQSRGLRYFLTVLVCLSVAATCIESGLHPLFLIALLPLASALNREDYSKPYVWSEKIIAILFLVYAAAAAVGIVLIEKQFVVPRFVVYFAFGALAARILSRLDERAIGQVICLTVGLILINCILTNDLIFGLILPFYLFALMGSLALSYLAKIRKMAANSGDVGHFAAGAPKYLYRRLVKSAGIILAVTVAAFALIPRPFLILPGLAPTMARGGGLGDLQKYIRYRDMAGMADRQRVAFFVEVEKGKLPNFPYWRGRVLDRTDGQGWFSEPPPWGAATRPYGIKPEETFVYKFTPYRLLSQTIYAAGLPLKILGRMDRPIFLNKRAEAIIHSPFLVSDSYTITGVDRPLPQSRASDRINTDKTGITPNIERLANEWASGTEIPAEKAKKLVSKLRSELSYVLENPVPPENSHPIEYFLLQSRRGNCEYFAGALAMMLRSLNIPARVVEGFAGVESTEDPNRFLVRFARGHAWVEALLGDGYWTTLDPTPATSELGTSVFWRLLVDLYDAVEFRWNKYVVHFDRADQIAMVQDVVRTVLGELSSASSINWRSRAPTAAVGIAAAILFALLIMLIRRRRRESDLSALYLRTMRDLTRKGLLTNVDTWHERNLSQIVRNYPESEQALLHFMTVYFRARFSTDEGIESKELRQARTELLDAIERSGNSAPARTS